MRCLPTLVVALLLARCATVSSDVTATDVPGTYTLTERASPIQGGARTAARTAMARADSYCRDRRLRMRPLDSTESGRPVQEDIVGPTGFTLRFRCDPANAVQMNVGTPG